MDISGIFLLWFTANKLLSKAIIHSKLCLNKAVFQNFQRSKYTIFGRLPYDVKLPSSSTKESSLKQLLKSFLKKENMPSIISPRLNFLFLHQNQNLVI